MLTACNGMRVSEKLNQIDSLIAKEQLDSAYVIHNSLSGTAMMPEDQAHYYLLATQLGYLTHNPLPSDSLLDIALAYYKEVDNCQKLADAYYYKSVRAEMSNNFPQAILYGKEAEYQVLNTDDSRLQYKFAENLAYLNGICGNNLIELQYAQKALAIAQRVQNKNWMVYSYNRISYAYANLDQDDSAFYYIERSIPYMNSIPKYKKKNICF